MKRILIATIKSWNLANAYDFKEKNEDQFDVRIIQSKENLTLQYLSEFQPDYIFFPHWSWKIDKEIYENFNCIVFHTSNLPGGRGGSPIQNQIIRKMYNTNICAIKVVDGYDEGDIYLKHELSLEDGTIADILETISDIAFKRMIPEIIEKDLQPIAQDGKATYFERRLPEMSNMQSAKFEDIKEIYDFIRMLDGEGYPKAFISLGNYRVVLDKANFEHGKLVGRFEVYEK